MIEVKMTHHKTKAEMRDSVDRSIGPVLSSLAFGPVELSDQQKEWTGDRMFFSLNAKMGPIKAPIKGHVDVNDGDVILYVDLGMFAKLLPENMAQAKIESSVKALIKG